MPARYSLTSFGPFPRGCLLLVRAFVLRTSSHYVVGLHPHDFAPRLLPALGLEAPRVGCLPIFQQLASLALSGLAQHAK